MVYIHTYAVQKEGLKPEFQKDYTSITESQY